MKQAVIIIGGYNSLWPVYLKMARDLEELTGLQAVGVPLMPWHWWAVQRKQEATNVLRRLEDTVIWARRRFRADRFILVGHSAGGVIARLYLCDRPVWGRVYAGVEHVAAIVTLGSPHCSDKGTETGWFLSDEANRLVPGAVYADQIQYRAVAGRSIQGQRNGQFRERRAFRIYRNFAGQGDIWGDGIVPVQCAGLDGAETLVLDGVAHSGKVDHHWYGGTKDIIRRWWLEGVRDAG